MNVSANSIIPFFAVSYAKEYILFGGAILLVAVVLFLWAAAIRKPPRQRRYKYHRNNPDPAPLPLKSSKRKRRSEPPRNPTLAETRGLPPVRDPHSGSDERYQY
jgi:hypothetical protein